MKPTPLRVRGKRKAPSATTPTPPKKIKRSLASVRASRSTRPRPSLESLPAELLELVLLYSANFSLPRASHVLGAKLSNRATLLRLFVWSFHDTWEQWFGIPVGQPVCHVPQAATEQHIPCHGDPVLQTAMLQLPWVTIDFILQAQQTWADHYGRGRWYQHSAPGQGVDADGPAHHHADGFSHFNARQCFETDYQQARKWSPLLTQSTQQPFHWRRHDVHPRTRMPTDLITGPWDDEKLRRLFWLTRGGIVPDADDGAMPPWEVKLQGLENAIFSVSEPNALVVNCLMGGWIFMHLPRDAMTKHFVRLERRIAVGGDSPDSKKILRWAKDALFLFLHQYYYLHLHLFLSNTH